MKPARSRFPTIRPALLIGAALISVGCSEELGPVPFPVARVHGVVTAGHRPISGGWIEFLPMDGTVGNIRSARLRGDGKFVADGVAIGENAIRLVDAPIERPDYRATFGTFRTSIRRIIPADPSAPLTIDLDEEWIRSPSRRTRGSAGTTASTGGGP